MRIAGRFLGFLAASLACATVCALPWMLGGVIPLARLVLLAGAVVAGVLSLLANLLSWRMPNSIPAVIVPLAGLVLLGTWQLRPVDQNSAFSIRHAIQESLPDVEDATWQQSASMTPADTRTTLSTLLAVCVLSFVCFDQIRSKRTIAFFSGILLLNGLALTGVGLSQIFRETDLALNDNWLLDGGQNPFATFVNPNNAAGWLCLCFALAAGWLTFHLKSGSADDQTPIGKLRLSIWQKFRYSVLQLLAGLTAWQIVAFVAVAFLGAGIAATNSRGGILALIAAVVLSMVFASTLKRLPLSLLVVAVCGFGVYGMLNWLDLNRDVVTEIKTLQDLDSAAGSRPRHWKDSLHVVADFPLTGTGLGSYRFSTLPYQSQHLNLWFRNADNHYVDMIVEGGLIGLLLFVGVGVCGLLTGTNGWRRSRENRKHDGGHRADSRALCWGIGTAAIVATLTQAASGFFDYGVAMPAATALLVVIVSAGAGCLHESEVSTATARTGAINSSRLIVFSIQLCLISSAVTYLLDQRAAAEIDKSIVVGTQLLTHPVAPDELDMLNDEWQLLKQRLKNRPDDPEGLRMLSQIVDARFRWDVMTAENGDSVRELAGFDMAWQRYTVLFFASRVAALTIEDVELADRVRRNLKPRLEESGLSAILTQLQMRFPLMPNIAEARAEIAVLTGHDEVFQQQAKHALFVEPSNAETHFRLGSIALKTGHKELATDLWQKSGQLSPVFQAAILMDTKSFWSDDEAMALFGPQTYAECVVAAQDCRVIPLKTKLLERADGLWRDNLDTSDRVVELLRVRHLVNTRRFDEAIEWLKSRVSLSSDRVALRRQLARLLEQQGAYTQAVAEWHTVQYLSPGDEEAATAISKLRDKK